MQKINLPKVIIENMNFLGIDLLNYKTDEEKEKIKNMNDGLNMYNHSEREALKLKRKLLEENSKIMERNNKVLYFFLSRNIKAIFGKDIFDKIIEIDIMKQEKEKADNKICLYCLGDIYTIESSTKNGLVFKNKENIVLFKIDSDDNVIKNTIEIANEENKTKETQKICLAKNEYFDYEKSILSADNVLIFKYPHYQAQSIAKYSDTNVFEIIDLDAKNKSKKKQSFLKSTYDKSKKKDIFAIKTSKYIINEELDYLTEIFEKIEEKCEINNNTLKK